MAFTPGAGASDGGGGSMVDDMELDATPSDLSMPSFVQPIGTAESEHFQELWRLSRALGGGGRLTEDRWRAAGWLPHGDELGSGERRKKARRRRLQHLADARSRLELELAARSALQEQPQPQEQQDTGAECIGDFDEMARDPESRQQLRAKLAKELEEMRQPRLTIATLSASQTRRVQQPLPADDHSACSVHTCAMQRDALLYQHGVQPCPRRYSSPLLLEPSCEAEFELTVGDYTHRPVSFDDLVARANNIRWHCDDPSEEELVYCINLIELCRQLFSHAQRLAELMRDVLLPDRQPILQPEAQYEVKYVAAALALRCGLFRSEHGSPSPRAAAAAMHSMVSEEPLRKNAAERVKGWLIKLQQLEQAYLDASADEMLCKIAAANRFLAEGKVTKEGSGLIPLMHSVCVDYAQLVMKARTKQTPAYHLNERRIAGGRYDWSSSAVPHYLLDR